MWVRRLAMLGLSALMAPAIAAWPSSVVPAAASTPAISVLSTSAWADDATGVTAEHLVGELRNDTGANVTNIRLVLDLRDSSNHVYAQVPAHSTAQLLAPGEKSPFEYVLVPAGAFHSFSVETPIPYVLTDATPAHNFTVTDTCSSDCQDNLSGNVHNASAYAVDGVTAIFTFYDISGTAVAQNTAAVKNGTGGTTLSGGGNGSYALDRSGQPGWATDTVMVEPDYPIDVNPATLDFGSQRSGTTSGNVPVTLSNSGGAAVSVTGKSTTGYFGLAPPSSASPSCTSVPAHSSCRVYLIFSPPASAMGQLAGTLSVAMGAAGTPLTVPLLGTAVRPRVFLNPTSLTFSGIPVGTTSSAQTVALSNTGNDTLTISSITTSGDFSTTNGCASTISPSDPPCNLSVTFSPHSGGTRNGAITITDDAIDSPQTVSLTGTGLGPGVSFNPATLDFGAVSVGSSSGPRQFSLINSGNAPLKINSIASGGGDFAVTGDNCPRSPSSLAVSNSCSVTATFSPTRAGTELGSVVVTDNAGDSPQSYGLKGLGAQATYNKVITSQPVLSNSDGMTWQSIDPQLTVTVQPAVDETAIISGNADLWTATSGVNQDLGITASVGGGPDSLLFWKESGGFAGTFSPNAAFVQGHYDLAAGFTYVFKLVWKANHNAPGSTIFAGAGPIGSDYSPTRLTVQLAPSGAGSAVVTDQEQLNGNDGSTWVDVSPDLNLTFNGALGTSAILSANADLWTATPHVNQDLAIFVTPPGQSEQLVAWKESGGSAGTFSPNAAYIQAVIATPSAGTYTAKLKWKMNVNAPSASIFAGAGPINGKYSPTSLMARLVNTPAVDTDLSTQQATLSTSDGAIWQPLSSLTVTVPASSSNAVAVIGANADLWTNTAGYNQDIGVFMSVDGGAATLVTWKESGGFAGTFSPNAAFAEGVVALPSGHSYTFTLQWKTNRPEAGATIAAGAGPIGTAYSPTRLTVEVSAN